MTHKKFEDILLFTLSNFKLALIQPDQKLSMSFFA